MHLKSLVVAKFSCKFSIGKNTEIFEKAQSISDMQSQNINRYYHKLRCNKKCTYLLEPP